MAARGGPLRWWPLVAVCLVLWSPAAAQDRRITVFAGSLSPSHRKAALVAQSQMRRTLERLPGYELGGIFRALDPARAQEQRELLDRGERHVTDGRDLLSLGKPEEAKRDLEAGLEALEGGLILMDDPGPLVEAHQLLGEIALQGGDEEGARRSFLEAISLDLRARLDGGIHTPDARSLYDELRKEVARTRGRLAVSSSPPGGTVFVDGRVVGIAPVRIKVRPTGTHLVRVELDGYVPDARLVEVDARSVASFDAKLDQIPQAKAFPELIDAALHEAGVQELSADHAINSLGEALELDELVLVRLLPTKEKQVVLQGYHYDFLDGQLINVGDALVTPGARTFQRDLGKFVDDLVNARLDMSLAGTVELVEPAVGATYLGVGGGGQREGRGEPGEGRGGVWLWAGLGGAAVAAGAVTAAFLLGGEEEPQEPKEGRVLLGFE